jgi:hypothetical protein
MPLPRNLAAAVNRWSREARFVFTGVVDRIDATTLQLLPAGPATAVVRIERIHRAPAALSNQVGQAATVRRAEETPVAAGHRRVFFTNPILYGPTLGLQSISDIEVPEDNEALDEAVMRVSEEMSERELAEHLASADAVVFGRVLGVRRAEPAAMLWSEHDPDWWVATVGVAQSIKGALEGEVAIRYPHSRDIRWYRVPKPEEGQEAVFVLHRDGAEVGGAALALLHPNDMYIVEAVEVERFVRLI